MKKYSIIITIVCSISASAASRWILVANYQRAIFTLHSNAAQVPRWRLAFFFTLNKRPHKRFNQEYWFNFPLLLIFWCRPTHLPLESFLEHKMIAQDGRPFQPSIITVCMNSLTGITARRCTRCPETRLIETGNGATQRRKVTSTKEPGDDGDKRNINITNKKTTNKAFNDRGQGKK